MTVSLTLAFRKAYVPDPGTVTREDYRRAQLAFMAVRRAYGFKSPGELLSAPGTIAKMHDEPIWALALFPAIAPTLAGNITACVDFASCFDDCVSHSGNGEIPNVIRARLARTQFLATDPTAFGIMLAYEIDRAGAAMAGRPWRMRLNAFSDLRWETGASWAIARIVANGGRAYDYTKDHKRNSTEHYRLTFSAKNSTTIEQIRAIVARGENVAIVGRYLKGSVIPSAIDGIPVVSGDARESRFDDPTGVIVALSAKGTLRPYRNRDGKGKVIVSRDVWELATY